MYYRAGEGGEREREQCRGKRNGEREYDSRFLTAAVCRDQSRLTVTERARKARWT